MQKHSLYIPVGALAGLSLLTPAAFAAELTTAVPAWRPDLAVSVKESYDDNLYLVGYGALRDRAVGLTTVSPKIGFNFAPLAGTNHWPVLAVTYAADVVTDHDVPAENYTAHRLGTTVKGQGDAASVLFDNTFTYIDGNENGPTFPDGRSGFATGVERERRAQWCDRSKVALQYDWAHWFVRPAAALTYYKMLTHLHAGTGYDNYCDRYDASGGLDVGYKFNPQFAGTLGYRYGHQYQEQYTFDPAHLSSSCVYQRILVGCEGRLWSWLTVAAQAGPDFRDYEADSATHTTPLNDLQPVIYYAEASLVASASAHDTVTFKYKQYQWVAMTGKLPYFDSSYDFSLHHQSSAKLGWDVGARFSSWDFTQGNIAVCQRDDTQTSLTAGASYAFTRHLSATATYAVDFGRNALDNLAVAGINPATREFNRQLVSVSALYKF